MRTVGRGQRHPADRCRSTAASASVNVLMNLGDRRLRRAADADQLSRQPEAARGAQLHAVEGDQHHRAGRQRHRAERREHRAPGRGGARPERRRSAASRGDHVQLQLAVQHHGRHRDAARVGAAVQRHDRHRQQRRRRQQRPAGRRRRGHRQVGVPRHGHAGRRRSSSRGASKLARAQRSCCGSRASTSSTTATSWAGRRRPTATPRHANPTFGQLVAVGDGDERACRVLANIDPPRMFQFQVRYRVLSPGAGVDPPSPPGAGADSSRDG